MQCYDFKYLGSTISNNASQDIELRYRMAIASAAFGKPQDRFGKTGMCLLKSSAMSIKVLSFLPSSVVLKHAWTIHQRKWRSFCLVQRPHYPARPKRFESRGQSENVFCACSPRIRHWCELTERAWENAVQGLAPCLYMVGHLKVIMNVSWRTDVAFEEKHEFKWRDINLNRWQESANDIPIWIRLIKLCWNLEQS